ncbi:NAD-dependent epimerase/dehydratase [Paludibacter propionicigenes WB4]|uniref:NAD-dependent epimerase/dehydratase n=1 Tax=Paludibacter propionicigenes (strain DSM 17365 / JCM 13257 / WB4) TaxID=694427 RepID=E4T324_PALPW|nr:SDR family oxidoreductase [Paludibacter propionicigenes]ADQ79118.1 NAD-dependent epimerase/dehydratase [Paludibacter propionicigenes WB4]
METIFLIGGSGFIGKNLAVYLSKEYNVCIYDKFIDYLFFENYPQISTFQMDLVEEQIPIEVNAPEYIINLASIVTAERDLSLFDGLISSNLKILLNLYNRFKEKKLKLFVQFGSSEEYGSENSPFNEIMRENPSSPYALVKQLTTNTAMMLNHNYSFPIMVVRPGNLFGPFQHKSKFIPYVIDCMKNNLPLNVSPCEQKRDFIYVEDFAYCIRLLLMNNNECVGEIVNVSSGNSISLKEIIEFSKSELQSTSTINYGAVHYRENEVMDLKCNMDKFERLTKLKIDFNILNRLKELIKK